MEITGLEDFVLWTYDKDGNVNTDTNGFVYDGNKGKVFDDENKEIKGLFKVDLASSYGATQANITGLAPTVNRVYGSNAMAEVNVGAEQPSIALAANDIPHQVYDLLTGLKLDEHKGYARKGQANPTIGGVIAHTHNTHKNIDLYVAFPMGTFVPGDLNMGTNTENPNVVHDALTLNAQARGTDSLLYEKFYSDETGFSLGEMYKYITGQTPVDNTAGNKQATDTQGNSIKKD